ncbi:unnamed protein product [Prunus brigantina]
MVAMRMHWEDRVARFNPSVRIDFDTSGEPPSPSPSTDDMAVAPESEPATGDAPSTEILGGQGNLAHDPVPNLEGTGFDRES